MDSKKIAAEIEEFEEVVEKYTAAFAEIVKGGVPDLLKEVEAKEAMKTANKAQQLKKSSAKKPNQTSRASAAVTAAAAIKPATTGGGKTGSANALSKQETDPDIKGVPKAAEPPRIKAEDSSADVSVAPIKELKKEKPKNPLDYSRFDHIKDEDDENESEAITIKRKEEETAKTQKAAVKQPSSKPKRSSPTALEILRILSEEARTQGNEYFGRGELPAAREAYTRAIDVCLYPTKEMIIEYRMRKAKEEADKEARRKGKDAADSEDIKAHEDPLLFIDRMGPNPEPIDVNPAAYTNRAVVAMKLGQWRDAREDCEGALGVLCADMEQEDGLLKDSKFQLYIKASCRKISAERKLGWLEEAFETLNDLSEMIERFPVSKPKEGSAAMPLTTRSHCLVILDLLHDEINHLETMALTAKIDPTDPDFSMFASQLRNYILSSSGTEGSHLFRLADGFKILLTQPVLHILTVPLVMPVLVAAVIEGKAEGGTKRSTVHVRDVTMRLYNILAVSVGRPPSNTSNDVRWATFAPVASLLSACASDVYFLDFISKSPFLHLNNPPSSGTPNHLSPNLINVDPSSLLKRFLHECFEYLQERSADPNDQVLVAAYLMRFLRAWLAHSPVGPAALLGDWNVQTIMQFFRILEGFLGSLEDVTPMRLDVSDSTLGSMACAVLQALISARSWVKLLNPDSAPTAGKAAANVWTRPAAAVVKHAWRFVKGKEELRLPDLSSSEIGNRHHAAAVEALRVHELKGDLYRCFSMLLPLAPARDVEKVMAIEKGIAGAQGEEVDLAKFVLDAMADVMDADPDLERSWDHMKCLSASLLTLMKWKDSGAQKGALSALAPILNQRFEEAGLDVVLRRWFERFVYGDAGPLPRHMLDDDDDVDGGLAAALDEGLFIGDQAERRRNRRRNLKQQQSIRSRFGFESFVDHDDEADDGEDAFGGLRRRPSVGSDRDEVALCDAACKLLVTWLESDADNDERWARKGGVELLSQVTHEVHRRIRQAAESAAVGEGDGAFEDQLSKLAANLALCVSGCSKKGGISVHIQLDDPFLSMVS
ncbi:hypothetical protein HDU96_001804 [Phlyctochytrium bullatum]|nr:hypothetical protein HDU96_001804 [Phlyctochytrium bullatum]